MDRIFKTDIIAEIDVYDIEGDINKVLEIFSRFKEESKNQNYSKVRLTIDSNYDPDEGYTIILVKGNRLENDKEYENRLKDQAKKDLKKIISEKNKNIKFK